MAFALSIERGFEIEPKRSNSVNESYRWDHERRQCWFKTFKLFKSHLKFPRVREGRNDRRTV
jgi:hypothetical protein